MPTSNHSELPIDEEGGVPAFRPLDAPFVLERYSVIGHLASGGMAEILVGVQGDADGIQRPVAIKRILPHLAAEPAFVDMMVDEARLVARVNHPNVVQLYDYVVRDGQPHIVMEFLSGITVAKLIDHSRRFGEAIAPALAAYLVAQAARGLHAAHELRGQDGSPLDVVHRDISPSNLFVTSEGIVKVLDFGIAKAARRLTNTEHGQLKGRLRYMSPEQLRTKPVDRRSDVYSLGIVLAECLIGDSFFRERDPELAIDERKAPPMPASLEAHTELAAIVQKATAHRPADRYRSADELRMDLERFLLAQEAIAMDRAVMERVFATAPSVNAIQDTLRAHSTSAIVVAAGAPASSMPEALPSQGTVAAVPAQGLSRGALAFAAAACLCAGAAGAWFMAPGPTAPTQAVAAQEAPAVPSQRPLLPAEPDIVESPSRTSESAASPEPPAPPAPTSEVATANARMSTRRTTRMTRRRQPVVEASMEEAAMEEPAPMEETPARDWASAMFD